MYLIGQDGETETDTLKKGRIIKQVRITGHEGKILSDIADDNLYLRHLPETYQSGRHIDAVPKYKEVFKEMFYKSGHKAHYNMMMGIEDTAEIEQV